MTFALRSPSNLTETPVAGGVYAAVLLRLCPAVRSLLPNYSTYSYMSVFGVMTLFLIMPCFS